MGHTHTPDIIVDPDPHFTINAITRAITKAEGNQKVSLIQYDHNSERFSFDIDKMIEGHNILDCNRIQIHYINMDSSNRSKRNIGLYEVDDLVVHPEDSTKATFTWLISEQATQYTGTLSFLVSFSCVNDDETLYRWNSAIYSLIAIAPGINNNNSVTEVYADELLKWENYIVDNLDALETELKNITIPAMVDQRYIERDFATSEEVTNIFALDTDDVELIPITPPKYKHTFSFYLQAQDQFDSDTYAFSFIIKNNEETAMTDSDIPDGMYIAYSSNIEIVSGFVQVYKNSSVSGELNYAGVVAVGNNAVVVNGVVENITEETESLY